MRHRSPTFITSTARRRRFARARGDEHYVNMNLMPKDAVDRRAALKAVPPLIKGYLRLSGFVGDGAVIDRQWGSVDVSIVVKTDLVTQRYLDKLT